MKTARMLAQHDLFVVPGVVMRGMHDVLRVLLNDTDDVEEAMQTQALIHDIESIWDQTVASYLDGPGCTDDTEYLK